MTISKVRVNNIDHDLRAKYLVPSTEITPVERIFTSTTSGVSEEMGEAIATIQKIKGNTIVWNQLFSLESFSAGGSGESVSRSGQTFTIVPTSTSTFLHMKQSINITADHVYIVSFYIKLNRSASISSTFVSGYFTSPTQWFTNYTSSEISTIMSTGMYYKQRITAAANKATVLIGLYRRTGSDTFSTSDSLIIKDPVLIDLTAIYGSGNEPTLEQFESLFPCDYYAYTTGTYYGVTVSGIKSVDSNNTWKSIADLDIPNITGRLNGTGSSVAVFPYGLQINGTTYDEMFADRAIKRIANDHSILSDEEEYTLDKPLDFSYASAYGGTESVVHSNLPSAPIDMLVSYSLGNIMQFVESQKSVVSSNSLKQLLDAMVTAGMISAYTMVYNADTGKYDFTIT